MSLTGLGVVETPHLGSLPSRSPSMRLFQVVSITSPLRASRHAASSSHHAVSCCGPRSSEGFSEEYVIATAPFGHISRRIEGLYSGMKSRGEQARIPLSPSTMTSRTSLGTLPTRAILLARPLRARSMIHSAKERVLPAPLPA